MAKNRGKKYDEDTTKTKDEDNFMNIETANKLLQYRKKSGLSQEELAEKIGVSRQAVSKWERAEASPDTDNLVTLAQVYGVSLDELLGLAPEQEEAKENTQEAQEATEYEKDEVHVSFRDGIHVNSKDGDKIDVSFKDGVHVVTKGEEKAHFQKGYGHYYDDKGNKHEINTAAYIALYIPFPIIITALYLAWGFSGLWGGWSLNWLLFFLIPLYYSLVDAIRNRNAAKFAFPALVAGIYVAIGMVMHIWHPTWIVFLTIPVFYFIAEAINKAVHKKNKTDENVDV